MNCLKRGYLWGDWLKNRDMAFLGGLLKWYYDQKVTFIPFLLYFESTSMYYRYLPCLILSHDFDERSDFLNYESSKRMSAITQFKNWSCSKERVGSREDLTSSIQTAQQLDSIIYSKASVDKKHTMKDKTWPSHSSSAYLISHVCLDVLLGWHHVLPQPNSLLKSAIF